MKRSLFLVLVLAAAAVLVAACGDDDAPTPSPSETPSETPTDGGGTPTPEPSTPTPTPEPSTPTPTPEPPEGEAPEGLWGHGKRTGVPEIDTILEAWEGGDIGALARLVRMQEQQCVEVLEGVGAPPECPDGVAEGTTVDVFQAAACEGYWVYEDGLPAVFESFVEGMEGQPYYLYAAWREPGGDFLPEGYRVQFARTLEGYDPFSPWIALDEEGRIVLYASGCNAADESVPDGADFVLAPK